MELVRSLIENRAARRGAGTGIGDHNRSLQQRGVTAAFKMCALRPSSFVVLMELPVTRLVHDGPSSAGLELGHHVPRGRNLRRAFSNLFLKMNVFGASEFPQIIFAAEIRLQIL